MTTDPFIGKMTAEQRCDVQEVTIEHYRLRAHRAEDRCEKLQKMYEDSQEYIKRLEARASPGFIAEQLFKDIDK